MSKIDDLHQKAMSAAEMAMLASIEGDFDKHKLLLSQAFELEREAANLVCEDMDIEPTRSVLHRSAAALAVECRKYRDAEILIATALIGSVPEQIAEELRDLYQRVTFERHLSLQGVKLSTGEFQLSIAGKSVGHGVASPETFLRRIELVEMLIHRTAERKLKRDFRPRGPVPRVVKDKFPVYVSAPRAASFAVTIRLSEPEQLDLPGFPPPAQEIIDDIMMSLALVNDSKEEQLRDSIPDENYYSNFLALARDLAPDGENIQQVGFTSESSGSVRKVALTRLRDSIAAGIAKRQEAERPDAVMVTVTGTLRFADSTHEDGAIKLIDDEGATHKIRVPGHMMTDIVKPLWGDRVRVRGAKSDSVIELASIDKSET